MTEGVVVAEVSIETTHVCGEFAPLFLSQAWDFADRIGLKLIKIFVRKESLEEAEERRCLVADLVQCYESTGPGGLTHVVGIVLLLLCEIDPWSRKV